MDVSSNEVEPLSLYLNSKLEDGNNPTANKIIFNFRNPIQYDEEVLPYVTLSQFTAFNTFASISEQLKNNIVTIVNVIRNGNTGVVDSTTYTRRIVIPDNRYSAASLFSFLNSQCNWQVTVTGANWYSSTSNTSVLYLGLGYPGTNSAHSTTAVPGFSISPTDDNKACILIGETSGGTQNPYVRTYTSGSYLTDPFQYLGIYMQSGGENEGFLDALGFITDGIPTPAIPFTSLNGFGFSFGTTVGSTTLGLPLSYAPLVGINAYNLFGPSLLYFCLDLLATNSRSSDERLDQSNILASIPVNTFGGGFIIYQPQSNQVQAFKSRMVFNSMQVSIYDENRNLVDFRGGAFQAKIDFTFKLKADFNTTSQANSNSRLHPVVGENITIGERERGSKRNIYGGVKPGGGLHRGAFEMG